MPDTLTRPHGAPIDWPEFPAVPPLVTDHPLPPDRWPILALSWRLVTAHVLNPDRGDVISAWLTQPDAPGPLAVAYRHRFCRSHPYGWECGVHVFRVPVRGGRRPGARMSYDCTSGGIARTPEEARAQALRHITELHQDAAVPYAGRSLRARHFYC
ncbi:hypothetical protein [Streptomyces sp. NPDC088775]|uniref:hypothetical protein n=1 Tax=Streptomyces sp. NPDC088775 TaxID=3365896 RepID=UPI0038275E79